ncbi:MAG: hypothetical protein H6718_01655 [Polyangiaceae bacterium]|nr:hypothetical protein [Myxococcales bacterium]MCB9584069.1 hypothetical protein [Polyangiaceae bacterium]
MKQHGLTNHAPHPQTPRTRLMLSALLAAVCLVGCGVNTRAAIKNGGSEPINVKLMSGEDQVEYGSVAPNTTTEFEKLGFDSYGNVTLESNGKQTPVKIQPEKDNTVTVKPDGSADVEAVYNEDNEYW